MRVVPERSSWMKSLRIPSRAWGPVLNTHVRVGLRSHDVDWVSVNGKLEEYSVVFNEWVYFGKSVECTNMELGKKYSIE